MVDSIFLVIGYLILPSIARMFDGIFTAAFWGLSAVVPDDALEKSARFVDTTVSLSLILLQNFAERVAEGEHHEFPLGYYKQLYHLPCFKLRSRAKLQFYLVHRHSSSGIKAAYYYGGRTLRRSSRQAG